jgi:probable rRNA maturation factor
MPLEIIQQHAHPAVSKTRIRRRLQLCLNHLKLSQAEISILLTDDAAIRELNHKYRGKDKPTDILSFGMREQRSLSDPLPPDDQVLGDLAVSLETIERQAAERSVSLEEELIFILIHGLLHLLGYDHARSLDEKRMQAMHTLLLAVCRPRLH